MHFRMGKTNSSSFAVVTGASRGLGRAFAVELAQRGINEILVSSNENISSLCHELINQYHIDCQYVVSDLTNEAAVLEAAKEILAIGDVFMLVNNAGLGGSRAFEQTDEAYIEKILHLNVVAPSLLIRQLLPNLLHQSHSYILNVSSMAALTPMGYKMVYPASKSYLYALSKSLQAEFKLRGLTVSVVTPGAMATSPEIVQRIEKQKLFGKLTLVPPERVARKCVRQLLRGRSEIVVNPMSWFFSKIIPNWIKVPILTRIVKREVENR